ncbi:MAG: hypothetical protein GMKNLPBB_03189 [Myxococcota bacterium]|nr:hypothetical protein [Myxococcota bacterium]
MRSHVVVPRKRTAKAVRLCFLALMLCSPALACAQATITSPVQPPPGKLVIRFGSIAPEGSPWEVQLLRVKKRVEIQSKGRATIKAFLGGALGGENQMVEECKRGQLHAFGGSLGALATEIPELNLFELPYLFKSLEEADYLLDHVLKEDISALLKKRGYVFAEWSENGWRVFATKSKGFIKKPEDVKGLRMRAQENDIHKRFYKELGAAMIPIPTTHVQGALKESTIDGFDQTLIFMFAASWHTEITHVSLSNHIYQPGIIVYSRKWFETLPQDMQDILLSGGEGDTAAARRIIRNSNTVVENGLTNQGVKVYSLMPGERDNMAARLKPVHDYYRKLSPTAASWLKKAETALEKYRAENGK